MTEPDASSVPRTSPSAGAPFELSRLTISVTVRGRASDPSGAVTFLRRALAAGVTTFDTVDVPDPKLSETVLARAFPDRDPRIVVLTAPPAAPSQGRRSVRLPEFAGPAGEPESAPRGPPGTADFRRLLEVEASAWPTEVDGTSRSTGTSVTGGAEPQAVRCHHLEDVRRASRATPPRFVSGPFSLLDQALPREAAQAIGERSLRWIARDALAGGRLDGSRFAAVGDPSVGSGPRSVRELGEEFAPVAALGFLARTGVRTLAQAALRYLTDLPWVATTVIPIPAATRWQEILGFEAAPPLSPEERARVDRGNRTPNGQAWPARPQRTPP